MRILERLLLSRKKCLMKGIHIIKKIKTGTMLYKKTIKLCDDNLIIANVNSRNDFIEKSIHFYIGYLNSNANLNYLNFAIENTLKAEIVILEDKISKILFKNSVELNVLNNIIASIFDIDDETMSLIRKKSIKEVKESNGVLSID